jgi:DNA-binding transcriptional regulator YiaG
LHAYRLVALHAARYAPGMNTPGPAVSRSLERIRRAYDQAAAAIERATEPEDAFAAADALARDLRELYDDQATRLVARKAAELREARRYSLAELARAANVSKSMAAHWDRRARKGA